MDPLPPSPYDAPLGLTFTEVSGDRVVATWTAGARSCGTDPSEAPNTDEASR